MSVETITTISPTTNKPIVTRNGLSDIELDALPRTARKAFLSYRQTSLEDRQKIVKKALNLIRKRQDELAKELTEQMGRPIAFANKEITTAIARAEHLLKISEAALQDTDGEAEKGFKRYIRKVPLGPVLVLFAWNVGVYVTITSPQWYLTYVLVSIPDSCELPNSGPVMRQFSHHKTIPANADDCRAHATNLSRGRA